MELKVKRLVSKNNTRSLFASNEKVILEEINIWDKNIEVEENRYYWKKEPIILSKGRIDKLKDPLVVELFSGCGGTSMGFEMAGYNVALGIDIHIPSVNTFKRNHPESAIILGDIKKITPELIKEVLGNRKIDVLIAGVPCQGFEARLSIIYE